jgi:hypothetical protein
MTNRQTLQDIATVVRTVAIVSLDELHRAANRHSERVSYWGETDVRA